MNVCKSEKRAFTRDICHIYTHTYLISRETQDSQHHVAFHFEYKRLEELAVLSATVSNISFSGLYYFIVCFMIISLQILSLA